MSDTETPVRTRHDLMVDQIVFKRDLDEVHLLLDHVSGQTDKSLDSLKVADETDPTGQKAMSTRAVVERITSIRYPPAGTPSVPTASDAAFLMVVKDQLNGMAHPARGLTVAYTSMFLGLAGRAGFPWSWLGGFARAAGLSHGEDSARRLSLSREIYPGLLPHARLFRVWLAVLVVVILPLWLGLTALTYWDNAFGRSILLRFDRIDRDIQTLVQANPDLGRVGACDGTPKPELTIPCNKLNVLRDNTVHVRADLHRFRRCDEASSGRWLHAMHWGSLMCGTGDKNDVEEQMVSTILGVFGSYILPMMFGLLGTMIAVIRKIQDQVGKSELHPRDFLLMQLLIPMGAVAAVAVGLFFSPNGTASGAGGLSADLTLTAGGLGFLAGYGSPAFFALLDDLLKQVFRLEKPPAKDPPSKPV